MILVGLLLVMVAVGIGVSRAINSSATEEYVAEAIPLRSAVQDLELQIAAQQSAVRGLLLTGDERSLELYRQARDGVAADLAFIRANLGRHPSLADLLRRAEPQIAAIQGRLARQVGLAQGSAAQQRLARSRVARGDADVAAFRATAALMVADTDEFVRDALASQDRLTDVLTLTLLALGALAIASAGWMSVVVRRRIAGLLDDLDAERSVSADAARRAEALQRVTAALAPALDEDAVLAALAGEASAVAGIDALVVARPGPGGRHLEPRGLAGGGVGGVDGAIDLDSDEPLAVAARTGRPSFGGAGPGDGDGSAWAVLPLQSGRGGSGAMALRFDGARGFAAPERTFLLTLADQTAQALERVRLHREQQEIAHVLQQSLLPRALPAVAGVEMAARYVTAESGQEVGGDLYDVFEDRGGRLCVMVGDACGKGPEAVALTALARYTVRALADGAAGPAGVLRRLNAAMREQGFGTLFLTAVHLSLERRGDAIRVTTCRAGHPHPLLVRRSGAVERLGGRGTVLGIFDDPPLLDHVAEMASGDTVIVFTDGLTEARQGTALLGEERLREAAAACVGMGIEECASHLLRVAVEFARGALRDDVAVVVLRSVGADPGAG